MTLTFPTEVEGYGRLRPSKHSLHRLGASVEASAVTLIKSPSALLSSVFQQPSCSPLIGIFLELSGSITASCSAAKFQQQTPPPLPPPSPYENYERGEERAVSGRACWGGNEDLHGSGEETSNVITVLNCGTGQSRQTHTHVRTRVPTSVRAD